MLDGTVIYSLYRIDVHLEYGPTIWMVSHMRFRAALTTQHGFAQ